MITGKNLQPQRKGIILLLVLAVLAMFAMLMATFMVVSSQQYREAASVEKLGHYVQSPEDDLDSTITQMLVGSTRKNSPIRNHSFGATTFGDVREADVPGLRGTAEYVSSSSNNDTHRFYLDYPSGMEPNSLVDLMASAGNVFTVRNPMTLKWVSSRIVDFGYNSGYYVDVRNFPGVSDPLVFASVDFYINPPAFTGMGAGYVLPPNDGTLASLVSFWADYGKPLLSDGDGDIPYAMQLNPNSTSDFGTKLDNFAWSLNVDYTAPDMASPFLGWFDMRFDNNGVFDPNSIIIPSYHRPLLISDYAPNNTNILRKLVMRPLPFDHPEFDGSNPPLALSGTTFPAIVARLSDPHGTYLDVDTDGDGIKDSVWVDVGLPVRTDLQGRTYKPLVAIKCIDLDGKLNLNAIGNLAEAGLLNNDRFGSGFGPAGTNLSLGLSTVYFNDPDIADVVAHALFLRRYLGNGEMIPRDDNALTDSILAQFGGLPPVLSSNSLYNFFGNLPDYWDQGMLEFDPLGNRYNNFPDLGMLPYSLRSDTTNGFWKFPNNINFTTVPYMFDPNRKTPYDQPFTLAELEAVLRQNDIDKDVLPGRLREMFGLDAVGAARIFTDMRLGSPPHDPYAPANAASFQQLKNKLNLHAKPIAYHTTTLSNDVPVPGPALADQGYASLYDLIRSCVVKDIFRVHGHHPDDTSLSQVQKNNLNSQIDDIALQLIKFLPDEIKQGGKINLNKLVEDPTMFLSNSMNAVEYETALYERMKMARGIYIILMALSYDKLYGVSDGAGGYIVEPYIEPSFLEAEKIKKLQTDDIDEFRRVCRELATTRLAQWAINVVEFTDADAVMTPFIFDVNPFNGNIELTVLKAPPADFGWGDRRDYDISDASDGWVLGVLTATPPADSEFNEYASMNGEVDYRLAWGMERPDLLLTETLAFHKRNVADTSNGGLATEEKYVASGSETGLVLTQEGEDKTPAIGDHDFDQIRMPQGSAFMELYCAANPNRPNYPQELYNGNLLDISKMSLNNGGNFPVWRMLVSGSNYKLKGSGNNAETEVLMENSIPHRMKDYGPMFSFQPNVPGILPDTVSTPTSIKQDAFTIDRYVCFTQQMPPAAFYDGSAPDQVYYNHSGNVGLAPNEYLVVGPRVVTHLASQTYNNTPPYNITFGTPSGLVIDLNYDGNYKATNLVTGGIGVPKVMIAAAEVSDSVPILGWDTTTAGKPTYAETLSLGTPNGAVGLGFSISEPFRTTGYYTQPTATIVTPSTQLKDAYGNLTLSSNQDSLEEKPSSSTSTKPLTRDGLVGTGMAPCYKSAFLQRLADPMREYNVDTNPYITVDWNTFDLKVYSGESANSGVDENELYFKAPLDEGAIKYFASRQWGVSNVLQKSGPLPNPWDRALDWDKVKDADDITDVSTAASDFGVVQGITLTGLTSPIQLPYQPNLVFSSVLAFNQFPVHSLGRLNTSPDLLSVNGVAPASTQNVAGMGSPANTPQYRNAGFPATSDLNIYPYIGAPVLLNGDLSVEPSQRTAAMISVSTPIWHNGPLPNSYEVMQIPASAPGRFGVEFVDKLNDLGTSNPPYDTNYLLAEDHLGLDINTPLSSSLKNPEKRSGSLGSNVRFGHLLNFQHSHGTWWPDWYAAHVDAATPAIPPFVSLDLGNALNFLNVPSRFVGTRDWYYDGNKYYSYSRFREPGKINLNTMTASGFAALLENRQFAGVAPDYALFDETRGNVNFAGYYPFDVPYRGSSSAMLNVGVPYGSSVNATLLRDNPNNASNPAFAPAINDANIANTYTALEGIQRLSDMTTTRSNTFAVWMTLGYFEVEKIRPGNTYNGWVAPTKAEGFDAIYPDGYMLKKEVGLETGEIKRHRAFYIIDRSVPFGYRRGQKLNSEDAILLKRFIE